MDDPLFSQCSCSGTMGYIHLSCLRKWLEVKKKQKITDNFISCYWKAFECEICKSAYPLMIKAKE